MTFITLIIYTSIYLGLIATSFYVLTYISAINLKQKPYTNKQSPTVTILIPAYNEEKSIKATMQSILESDYPEEKLEIIVIDNSSTDQTLKLAKEFKKDFKGKNKIKIFTEKQQGKGYALNLGISQAKGEIIVSMDADTFVEPYSLKNMVKYFKDPQIMSVSPAIVIHKPKNILQRVQYIEYVIGLFLRKTFAILNAIHITPGAFSAYRASFFKEHGGYETENITEDLELAMRIQYYQYKIENSPESPAYTIAPNKFSHLLKQRRRWYIGLMKNMRKYKKLFSKDYGDMGIFVLPIAWISIFFAVFITLFFFIKTILDIGKEINFLKSINFDLGNLLNINYYFWERLAFLLFTNTIFIFIIIFILIILAYLFYASKKLGKVSGLAINLPLFFIFFAVLFGFWWIVSLFYMIFNGGKVSWK
ncbi:glycosyltransferase family 2 protein [archaeon]|jgi:peptidoglycan-N-acetylglucosamine deacetylase|nr:glycosyltransferase family 2 protein [archaeon]